MPFAWLLSSLLILSVATIILGYVPKYGNPVDPYTLGLDLVTRIHLLLFCVGIFSACLWPFFTIQMVVASGFKTFSENKIPVLLFISGLVGYLLFAFTMNPYFSWIMD